MALLMELSMLLRQASMALARVGMRHKDAVHWTWSHTTEGKCRGIEGELTGAALVARLLHAGT